MKVLSFTLLMLISTIPLNAQILNGDFEDWSGGEPVYWYSSNNPVICYQGANVNIFQTSNAYSGNSAVYGKVIAASVADSCGGGTYDYPPSISTYSTNDFDSDLIGFPVSGRPKQLRVHYIYKPVGEGGAFTANVYLTKWDISQGERVVVGSGGFFIFNTIFLDSVYTEYASPMTYYLDEDPDTIVISFSLFSSEVGSEFYLDDISLSFMQIIRPANDEVIIAGEKNTIEWDAGSGNINIMYSLDDGNSYTTIVSNYPADSSKYVWDVPGNLLSAKAKIKIEDSQDNTQSDEKSVYIKPWQLTRIDGNDDFELFEPNQNGWQFRNDSTSMWPLSWWEQFIYYGGIDPNTGSEYPLRVPFISAITPDFPDWPAFVDAFGQDECYTTNPPTPNSYRGRATTLWDGLQGSWGGSCYGFAVTSLLYFYYQNVFLLQNPGIGSFPNLFSAQITDDARKAINKYFIHQFGDPYRSNINLKWNTVDARQTLQELKDMFSKTDGDGMNVNFYNNNGSGGHAVTPYKLERVGTSSTFNVRVYDSNNPGATNRGVRIDSAANTWTELTGLGWGTGTTGCILDLKSSEHLFNINIPTNPIGIISTHQLDKSDESSALSIYNTSNAELDISNSEGNIGYADSLVYNNITGALPIIPLTGVNHPPIGYTVPQGDYSLEINNFSDSSSYVFILGDSTIYNYRRYDAKTDENDILSFSNGIGIENPDQNSKSINLETIIEEDSTEKVFVTDKLEISKDDSIHINELNRANLLFKNFGTAKSYDLQVRSANPVKAKEFNHKNILIAYNSSHQIVPAWGSLETSAVKILIDNGIDGSIDDSIFVENQLTDVKEIYSSNRPNNYNLSQNYPNPFNPTTTIVYDIPKQSYVTLKVYNILGQEVATLVDGIRQAGSYREVFNASTLASGIYIYKLTTNEFVSSKKMIIIK